MLKLNLLGLSLFLALALSAQNNQLISPNIGEDLPQNQPAINFLLQQPGNASVKFIDLRLDILNDFNNFQLTYNNKDYEVSYNKQEIRGPQNYSWVGDNTEGDGYIIISVLGDDIQAIIRKGIESYKILTTGTGAQVIVEIDQSEYPLEDCFFDDQPENKQAPAGLNTQNYPTNKTALEVGCPQTAIILYTPDAATGIKGLYDEMLTDIKNSIQEAVKDMNEAFEDSEITTYDAVEIALISEFNFDNSTSTAVDLDSLRRMPEAIALKDNYNADFLILITDVYTNSCGRAYVQATKSSAFGIVPYTCMITNLSLAHEVGHLFGAGHDVENNGSKIHPYNNGYIYPSGKWYTIMSYWTPCGSDCRRIAHFSNPDVTFEGVLTGTESLENNARVIRDYNNILASFGQPDNTMIIDNNIYENNNNLYTNIAAKQNISTNGNVTIQNEACLILSAGQEIILNNNFEVKTNSILDISINGSIETCE